MQLFLIRHGETVHNVGQVYAGVTDSALTNHGVVQADLLGRHLTAQGLRFSHVFSSDLSRARNTAEAICRAQSALTGEEHTRLSPVARPELREQDFGPFEGRPFASKARQPSQIASKTLKKKETITRDSDGVETKDSMIRRANIFLDDHIVPILRDRAPAELKVVAVVAHGLILSTLWRCLLRRFLPHSVMVGPNALPADRPVVLEHIGAWSNTGYLELHATPREGKAIVQEASSSTEAVKTTPGETASTVVPDAAPVTQTTPTMSASFLPEWIVTIRTVNGQDHVRGLKRTRGGVGSSGHDGAQRRIETFFKKLKTT